jgi:type III secretion protein J
MLALTSFSTACRSRSVTTVSTEAEAIEIIDVLRENGFDADKEEVGETETKRWSVLISVGWFSSGDAALAMQVLRDHGLPRPEDKGMEGAYEEQGMFPSESAQKAQRLKELKTEIERQLRMLPGVVRVSVNIVLPEDNTLNLNPYPASASVIIVHRDPKPAFTGEQIQNSVAGSVPNLKAENVRVTMAQQQPRPVQRRDLEMRRRSTILAILAGFVTIVLTILLIMFWRQSRRKSAELAELRDASEREAEEDEQMNDPALAKSEQRSLDAVSSGNTSGNGTSLSADARNRLKSETAADTASPQPKSQE